MTDTTHGVGAPEDHEHDEHGDGPLGGHHHPILFHPRPLVHGRAFEAIDAALRATAAGDPPALHARRDEQLASLRAACETIDWLASLSRRVLHDDGEATVLFRRWLANEPGSAVLPTMEWGDDPMCDAAEGDDHHDDVHVHAAHDHDESDGTPNVFSLAPIIEVAMAVSYAANSERRAALVKVASIAMTLAPWIGAMHVQADAILHESADPLTLFALLREFAERNTRSTLPLALAGDARAFVASVPRFIDAWLANDPIEQWTDLTSRPIANRSLASVSPNEAGAGESITLLTRDGMTFPSRSDDLSVMFQPRGVSARVIEWTGERATRVVVEAPPSGADGHVFFAHVPSSRELEPITAAIETLHHEFAADWELSYATPYFAEGPSFRPYCVGDANHVVVKPRTAEDASEPHAEAHATAAATTVDGAPISTPSPAISTVASLASVAPLGVSTPLATSAPTMVSRSLALTAAPAPGSPGDIGSWSELGTDLLRESGSDAPGTVSINAALLPNGKVLVFAPDVAHVDDLQRVRIRLVDPKTGAVTRLDDAIGGAKSRNLFCAGQSFLADGSLLMAGGHSYNPLQYGFLPGPNHDYTGTDHDVHRYDPLGNAWSRAPNMKRARWYPTVTTLPDGRALIIAGSSTGAWTGTLLDLRIVPNCDFDVYDPRVGGLMSFANRKFFDGIDMYPFVFVMPGGALFVHYRDTTRLVRFDATRASPVALEPRVYRTQSWNTRTYPIYGSAVLLPIDATGPQRARVLVVGGGNERIEAGRYSATTPAANTAEIFDFDGALALGSQPGWRTRTIPMSERRFMCDATILADGSVLVSGGASTGFTNQNADPVLVPELFDPVTETFRRVAVAARPRRYHSVALLLPDGRVLKAGSTGSTMPPKPAECDYSIEIYSPPYLHRGARPDLGAVPALVSYASEFEAATTSANAIVRAALVRAGAVTHANNMDQRYVNLPIRSRSATAVRLGSPIDATVAPPGPYLLFLLDAVGVPSEGKFVTVHG